MLLYCKAGISSFVHLSQFSLRSVVKGKTGSENEWTGEVLNAKKSFTLWYLPSGSRRKCSICHLETPHQWTDILCCQYPVHGGEHPPPQNPSGKGYPCHLSMPLTGCRTICQLAGGTKLMNIALERNTHTHKTNSLAQNNQWRNFQFFCGFFRC